MVSIICTSAVAGTTRAYARLNVRQFAAQTFLVLKRCMGQSRSKSSFPRIGREAMIG